MKIFSSVLSKIVPLFTITVFFSRFKQLDLLLSLSIFVQVMKESPLIQCCQQTRLSFCFSLFLLPFSAWQEINLFISDFLLTGDSFLYTNTDGNAMVFRSLLCLAKDNLRSSHLKCLEQTHVCLVTWKYSPTSLHMATIHLLNIIFFWKLEIWSLVSTFHLTIFSTFWYTAVWSIF